MESEFLLNQGIAIAILIAIGWFFANQFWPWIRERDIEERQRKHDLACMSATTSQSAVHQLSEIERHLINPIRVAIVEDTDMGGR